jgi:hypothetical protein
MNKFVAAAAFAAVSLTAGNAVAAPDRIQVGVLTCDVDPGVGLIIGSSKDLTCKFERKGKKAEVYHGTMKKVGIDIGFTAATKIAWLVFAAVDTPVKKHALAGTYVGASTEATLGVGLGGNWLIGGSKKSFALQPWSIQGQVGINWSLTWTGLTLD